jgi:autocrine motility factor receptor
MDVQDLHDISGWCMWFVALGFFSLISELCKDRFEYLSFSPRVATSAHVKVVALLGGIVLSCGGLLMVCAVVGWQFGFSHFAFLCSEVFILSSRTVHTLIRYMVYLWDMHHSTPWENKGAYLHYVEVILELGALGVDFIHHLHMIMWGYWFPSMASLVLMMRLRFLYQEIQLRLRKHYTYLQVSTNMDTRFPSASSDELSEQNQCSICWEEMTHARKLPCEHIFHMFVGKC